MTMHDMSGPIHDGMLSLREPYFSPEIRSMPIPNWLEYPVYSESVSMPLQTGTYLETAAHVYKDRELIADVALERVVNTPAVLIRVDVTERSGITKRDLEAGLARIGREDATDCALVVATGWGRRWYTEGFIDLSPHFTRNFMDCVIRRNFTILGSDISCFDDQENPSNHLLDFFEQDRLLLGPLSHLDDLQEGSGAVTCLPIKFDSACASPVRAIWLQTETPA